MANTVTSACCVVVALLMVCVQGSNELGGAIQCRSMGSNVTLECDGGSIDSKVRWQFNGRNVAHSERVIVQGTNLILRNVDSSHTGTYSCYEDSTGDLKNEVTIQVGNAPMEPNVMCRSSAYPISFYCTWHLPNPTFIPTEFNVSVRHGEKEIEFIRDDKHKNRCNVKFVELFSASKYTVTVVARNSLGSNSTSISFKEETIVKPDPPEIINVNPVPESPQRMVVVWQNPPSWPEPDAIPLKYFLRYKPIILDDWQHVEVTDVTFHTITDAYAGKEHIIQVAAKDNEAGTWSEWSKAVRATPWTQMPVDPETETKETTSSITSAAVTKASENEKIERSTNNSPRLISSMMALLLGVIVNILI
ncbi:ciliary neurotrophic factor receptor subunit alpha [Callorhinchus milii]|uniref:ciliary neurotrophic factor receptor subunit alpha n=1 Tax=Callorhinchus milii TaxID=7868 RepID=UPI0004575DDE|nr:ciliary neurotrophic factor receptor subunit alpha [Callorhinchus milii]XP_042191765.1 ciliary neurotrophic factor receptor subunit alpha [Callorhinchus milii]XP_042191766.1 ciliary neurotrophic factor receptor subunit alpha [Callorhinchus milii]|eukprot:gi/632969851/ref/XP_007901312.1/ PREDICTED: ciliary neurotrophic factor receptor subunit alpha-like [Callorhinchus milii]